MAGVWAVLVAAGRGERFGGDRPKAFAALAGRPLLAESLERLDACPRIEALVVVAPAGWEEPAILLAEELGAGKVTVVVAGGETRSASVRLGLAEVPQDAETILVHDAARPLVSDEVVERVLAALDEGFEGAVPGLPVADTLKRAADGVVVETLERAGVYAVQTPQAFRADALRRALAGPLAEGSDCAAFVEAAGGRVRIVEGDPALLKVTTRADLEAVEARLAGRDR
jgi:2-C-methyl-D-erythritol 4-phosphate cytidylyltransferase